MPSFDSSRNVPENSLSSVPKVLIELSKFNCQHGMHGESLAFFLRAAQADMFGYPLQVPAQFSAQAHRAAQVELSRIIDPLLYPLGLEVGYQNFNLLPIDTSDDFDESVLDDLDQFEGSLAAPIVLDFDRFLRALNTFGKDPILATFTEQIVEGIKMQLEEDEVISSNWDIFREFAENRNELLGLLSSRCGVSEMKLNALRNAIEMRDSNNP